MNEKSKTCRLCADVFMTVLGRKWHEMHSHSEAED